MLATLGDLYREQREFTIGADMYRRALEIDPKLDGARYALGVCIFKLGAMPEASDIFESLISDGICNPKLLYGLSQIPHVYSRTKILALIERLEQDGAGNDPDAATLLNFARASALHNMGQHRDAWDEAVRANAPIRDRMRETSIAQRKIEQSFLDGLSKFRFPERKPAGKPSTEVRPLFILGPSRSGKTTLERLVGTHPGVLRGAECPLVEQATTVTFQAAALPTRDRLVELPSAFDATFAERIPHNARTARARCGSLHQHSSGSHLLCTTACPSGCRIARFIFIKRNRNDVALRIFLTLYDAGNSYAYDLDDIHRHLDWYYAAMDEISSYLPGRCLTVDYEQIIENPDAVLDDACRLCGLTPRLAHFVELGDDRGCGTPYAEMLTSNMLFADG